MEFDIKQFIVTEVTRLAYFNITSSQSMFEWNSFSEHLSISLQLHTMP